MKIKKWKIQETKLQAIPRFPAGISGPHRESFAVRDHLRSCLGMISGLEIICDRKSFAALYRPGYKTLTNSGDDGQFYKQFCTNN